MLEYFRSCPNLVELVLERTPIFLPGETEGFRTEYINKNIKK